MGRLELWVRSEWRNGFALSGLALLVAIGGAFTLPATAGARRADKVAIDAGMTGVQTYQAVGIDRLTDDDDTDTAFVTTPNGQRRLQSTEELSSNSGFVRLDAPTGETVEQMQALGFEPAVPPSRTASLDQIGSVPRMLAAAPVALGLEAE